jgi:ADP-heptose:LPS heptosyltransferase
LDPDTLRKIDYWVGIPICIFLTLVYKIARLIGLKNPRLERKPKNILFLELAEMGSTVLAYPAMRRAKTIYPDANLYFLLFEQNRASLDLVEVIGREHVFTIDHSSIYTVARDTLRFVWLSRREGIDTTINLETFIRFGTILSYLSGARQRVGFYRYHQEGLYIGNFLTHRVIYNPQIHMAYSYLSLVEALSAPNDQIPMVKIPVNEKVEVPKWRSPQTARDKIWKLLQDENREIDESKKLVIVNPNASKLISIRKWPLENYAGLIKNLLQDTQVFVALTGTAAEVADADYICNQVKNPRVLNLAGKTTLTELVDLFSLGSVVVTNDSGPAHFASLTDIHIVVFFGPETPRLYKPLSERCTVMYADFACSPCVSSFNQKLSPCNNNLCLKSIGIEQVSHTVKEILARERVLEARPALLQIANEP